MNTNRRFFSEETLASRVPHALARPPAAGLNSTQLTLQKDG
jgi:hypothetical protein